MKISIIVPVYHVEEYISQCIQSVANQTMTEGIECIIVDDCGGDNSITIANNFISNYKGTIDFKIIKRDCNGGLSAARNTGIDAAQGDYLYFLDSDDEITPNCMEVMFNLIERYGMVDLVQGSFYENEEEKEENSPFCFPQYTIDRKEIKKFLLKYDGYIVGAQSRLIKRDFLIKNRLFFKEGIIHEDNYWTFFLAKHVTSMAFCQVRTYYHRYNPNSITGNINKKKESIAYASIVKDFSENIDDFLPGYQKELILNNIITALKGQYYNSKKDLLAAFYINNSLLEKVLLRLYLQTKNSKILHLLIRLYKIND